MIRYNILYIIFISIYMNGCTLYVFDSQYYKAKKYAKQYSATYIVNKNLYDEIISQKQNSTKHNKQRLDMQEYLQKQIKHNKNIEWINKKEYYMDLAFKKSGYYSENNAKSLFIMDTIEKKFPTKKLLSNGKTYYNMLDNYKIEIPSYIIDKIGGDTSKNMKFKRIIYPQFFYIDDNNKPQIISVVVLYLYTNINKIYNLKEDDYINSIFANGEWIYLKKSKVIYLDI